MKKLFFILCACFCVSLAAYTQDSLGVQNEGGPRIQALKIAYITKRLNLSPEEAQRFWPIYNKYDEEIHGARAGRNQGVPVIVIQQRVLDIKKKYNEEFKQALPVPRVNLFFQAEEEFGRIVLRTAIERQQLRMQRRPNFRQ
jgi:hypothetical protein